MLEKVTCPFCGEPTEIVVDGDPGLEGSQAFVQDCDVCCHPIAVLAFVDDEGHAQVTVERA